MSRISRLFFLFAFAASALQAPAHAAGPDSITTSGCEEQEFSLQYPAAPFKKMLPPGFKLHTLDPTGLIASVDISADHCDSVDGGAGSHDFIAFVEVDAPAEYQQDGIIGYGLLLKLWSDRPQTVDTFAAWGFGAQAGDGAIDFGMRLDLLGRTIGSVTIKAEGNTLTGTTLFTARKTSYAAGRTRAFAQDADGVLHVIDAAWTDQTFQYGAGTFVQSGAAPLPLPLIVQAYPVLAGHATDYSLTLHSVR